MHQLAEIDVLQRQGAIEPPDLLYLTRRAMQPQRDAVLPRASTCAPGMRLVRPGFSYKTTGYVLWQRGAQKLLASGYLERRARPRLNHTFAGRVTGDAART